jgi:hypothetical protein
MFRKIFILTISALALTIFALPAMAESYQIPDGSHIFYGYSGLTSDAKTTDISGDDFLPDNNCDYYGYCQNQQRFDDYWSLIGNRYGYSKNISTPADGLEAVQENCEAGMPGHELTFTFWIKDDYDSISGGYLKFVLKSDEKVSGVDESAVLEMDLLAKEDFNIFGNSADLSAGTDSYPNGGWTFVGVVIDQNEAVMYQDGTEVASSTISGDWNICDYGWGESANMEVYTHYDAGHVYVQQPLFWDTSLTQTELIDMQTTLTTYDNADYEVFSVPMSIYYPEEGETVIVDDTVLVSGSCPTNGENRIAVWNGDVEYYENGVERTGGYDTDCVNHSFQEEIVLNSGVNGVPYIIAKDKDSVCTEITCSDDKEDVTEVDDLTVIEGEPPVDEWYDSNSYDQYYSMEVIGPDVFERPATTLPKGATSTDVIFNFHVPDTIEPDVYFRVDQYDSEGNLIDGNYHDVPMDSIATSSLDSYAVNFEATTTQMLHYSVKVEDNEGIRLQFPFGLAVSDYEYIQPPEPDYMFPKTVEMLKNKVGFNYFFYFYDEFKRLFSADMSRADPKDLDFTLSAVSGDGEYDLEVPVFSASNKTVQSFADGLRPYITAFLWLGFAIYIVFRITHIFTDNV